MGLFDGTPLERPVLCDQCGQDSKFCGCLPPDTAPDKQTLRVRLEKRKNGKVVTCVTGFQCRESTVASLFGELKSFCGAGGSCTEESLEVQGDHTNKICELLLKRKYKIKK